MGIYGRIFKSEIKGLCNEHSYPMLKFLINEIGMMDANS